MNQAQWRRGHPRLMLDENEWEALRRRLRTDGRLRGWYEALRARADGCLSAPPLVHELRDGTRLLHVA